MAKIRIVGDSSGYVELAAPNAAGNNTLELPSNATKLVGADASNSLNVTGIATFSSGIVGNVTGNVNSTGVSTFSNGITIGTGASISSPATNVLALGTNNSERVRIDSSGRLGIGTNDPTNTLHVVNSSYPTLSADAGSNKELRLQFHTGDNTANVTSIGAFPLIFQTNSIERVRIDSSGRVTTPYQPSGAWTLTVNASGVRSVSIKKNIGNHVSSVGGGNGSNGSVGRFTAPVNGAYLISLASFAVSSSSQCLMSVYGSWTSATNTVGATQEVFDCRTTRPPEDGGGWSQVFYFNANDYWEIDWYRTGAPTAYIDTSMTMNVTVHLLG